MSVQQAVGNVEVVIAAILACLFCLLYGTSAPWWRSEGGRHVMAFMASIAAVLDLATVKIFVGDTWWFAWARLVVFALIPAVFAWRIAILWRVQIAPRLTERRAGARRHGR